jgi:hypothetical protein
MVKFKNILLSRIKNRLSRKIFKKVKTRKLNNKTFQSRSSYRTVVS